MTNRRYEKDFTFDIRDHYGRPLRLKGNAWTTFNDDKRGMHGTNLESIQQVMVNETGYILFAPLYTSDQMLLNALAQFVFEQHVEFFDTGAGGTLVREETDDSDQSPDVLKVLLGAEE